MQRALDALALAAPVRGGGAALGVAAAGCGGRAPAGQRPLLHLLPGEASGTSKAGESLAGLTCTPAHSP